MLAHQLALPPPATTSSTPSAIKCGTRSSRPSPFSGNPSTPPYASHGNCRAAGRPLASEAGPSLERSHSVNLGAFSGRSTHLSGARQKTLPLRSIRPSASLSLTLGRNDAPALGVVERATGVIGDH